MTGNLTVDQMAIEKNMEISPLIMMLSGENQMDNYTVDYSLSGVFYREMLSAENRKDLISNIIASISNIKGFEKEEAIKHQLYHFFRIDTMLGIAVADGLKIKIASVLLSY